MLCVDLPSEDLHNLNSTVGTRVDLCGRSVSRLKCTFLRLIALISFDSSNPIELLFIYYPAYFIPCCWSLLTSSLPCLVRCWTWIHQSLNHPISFCYSSRPSAASGCLNWMNSFFLNYLWHNIHCHCGWYRRNESGQLLCTLCTSYLPYASYFHHGIVSSDCHYYYYHHGFSWFLWNC